MPLPAHANNAFVEGLILHRHLDFQGTEPMSKEAVGVDGAQMPSVINNLNFSGR